MIRIKRYEKEAEEIYWKCVKDKLPCKDQEKIVASCEKYLPTDFFSENADFKELVLAPYDKIRKAWEYIELNSVIMQTECFDIVNGNRRQKKQLYKKLYDTYGKVMQALTDDGTKMNVFLVQQTGFTVCPYCNRDYINCRSKEHTGAQLDHFYPRSKYPIFSVCLYNLVPVCGVCNRIKLDNTSDFASPFDEEIDWENDVKFSYDLLDMNRKKITITANRSIRNNIDDMRIEEAYQIHETEINELLDKVETYSKTQIEEFREVLYKIEVTEQDVKNMVFGPEITEESMRKKPLAKMMRDLERELGIYK